MGGGGDETFRVGSACGDILYFGGGNAAFAWSGVVADLAEREEEGWGSFDEWGEHCGRLYGTNGGIWKGPKICGFPCYSALTQCESNEVVPWYSGAGKFGGEINAWAAIDTPDSRKDLTMLSQRVLAASDVRYFEQW